MPRIPMNTHRLAWWMVGCWLVASVRFSAAVLAAQPEDPHLTEARRRMVNEELADIKNPRVRNAALETPRHLFVPASQRRWAYYDTALPIGAGQTISPPFVVAYMTEKLDPQPTDRVLEIGTGSGYQAAILSPLVAEVYTIEIVESLGQKAAETLRKLNYKNVFPRVGDGFQGWAEHAPFDKIIVTCSPENVPPKLVEQLREGGRMVIPLGERYQQTLYLLEKVDGKLEQTALEPTFFVPMTGRAEELRQKKNDDGVPRLINGDFETKSDDEIPTGWYYIRQAAVVESDQAPQGHHILQFENETSGKGSQALQSLAMDGRRVRELEVSLWVEAKSIRVGPTAPQIPHVEINFFDEQRAPVGARVLGSWTEDTPWTHKKMVVAVPPRARLAMIAVGLFGSTGRLAVDDISVRALQAGLP